MNKISFKSNFLFNSSFFLVLAYLIFFHNYSAYLSYGFHFDFLIVFPYTIYFFKRYSNFYFSNPYYKNFVIIFLVIAIWNILSVIAGLLDPYYSTTIKGVSMTINYVTMLVYLTYGAILAINSEKFNLILILHIVSLILITVVMIEYFNPAFAYQLKVYYNIFDEMKLSDNLNRYRLIGTMRNSNNLGLMASMLLFLTIFNDGNRIIRAVITVGFFLVIFMTGSRTAFGLLLFIGGFFMLNFTSIRNTLIWFFLVVIVGYIAFSFIDISDSVLMRRIEYTDRDTMFDTRKTTFWNNSIKVILDSPVFGIGLLKGFQSSTVDNFYLRILQTNGIVGFILWIGFFYQLFKVSLKYYFKTKYSKILLGFIGIIVLSSMTADFYFFRVFYPFTMIIIGYYFYKSLIEMNYFRDLLNRKVKT